MHSTYSRLQRLVSPAVIVAVVLFPFLGCGTTERQVRTIVRDAEVGGPVFSPPVHIVNGNSRHHATISAYAMFQRMSLLRGIVEGSEPGKAAWLYPGDTVRLAGGGISFQRHVPQYNLQWRHPEFAAGMHFDLAGGSTAFSFGGSIAATGGTTFIGWSAGIGLFSAETTPLQVRLDAGIFGQLLDYEARSVAITTTTTTFLFGGSSTAVDTAFFRDRNSGSSIGYYGSLTFNSANPTWVANIFFQAHCVVQPILSYTPSTRTSIDWLMMIPVPTSWERTEVSSRAVFVGITPGIYVEPSPGMVMTAGVRCLYDASETFSESNTLFIPFVQVGLRAGM